MSLNLRTIFYILRQKNSLKVFGLPICPSFVMKHILYTKTLYEKMHFQDKLLFSQPGIFVNFCDIKKTTEVMEYYGFIMMMYGHGYGYDYITSFFLSFFFRFRIRNALFHC